MSFMQPGSMKCRGLSLPQHCNLCSPDSKLSLAVFFRGGCIGGGGRRSVPPHREVKVMQPTVPSEMQEVAQCHLRCKR